QGAAVDLTCTRLGDRRDELDLARILVLAQARLHEVLYQSDAVRILAAGDDERLRYVAAEWVRRSDDGSLEHVRVLEEHILDFQWADRPPRRYDDVVIASRMKEIPILVYVP